MSARLSLTFDNGPTPGITERILEVLARHRLRVTFFVIGEKLRDRAAAGLLAEMAAAGHWIGNHTLPQSVALGDRPDAAYARTEIEEAQALVGTWPGQEKLFRPYGKDGLAGAAFVQRTGPRASPEPSVHQRDLEHGSRRLDDSRRVGRSLHR
jgi:peptidoglycan-N-acetylglucosamine deacetylase